MSTPPSPEVPGHDVGTVVRLLRAIAVAANAADVVEDAAPATLEAVCGFTGWPVGHLYLVDPDGSVRATRWWQTPDAPGVAEFVEATMSSRFDSSAGLPGRVVRSGAAVWLADCSTDPEFIRRHAAVAAGLHAAVGFPLLIRDEVVGVLEFFSSEIAEPDAELAEIMTDVGRQLGRVVERSRAADALRASEERLAAAQAVARVGSWEWDVATNRVTWSAELYRLFGVDPGDFLPSFEGYVRLLPERDRALAEAVVAEALRTGQAFAFDHGVDGRDGESRILHGRGEVERDAQGRVARMHGTTQDVTEVRRAARDLRRVADQLARVNAELQAAGELKDHFLSVTNHELRTPLTTILGFSSTLLERWDRLPDDDRRAFVGRVHEQAKRLSALVEDVLTLSSVEAGALHLEPRPVLVRAAIEAAVETAGMDRAHVSIACDEKLRVRADQGRLEQILVNYLSNARKYGAPPFLVTGRPVDGGVDIEVRDEGPGVPPEFVSSLFDRFSQASRGASRTSVGTGLGLAIAHELARAMGGTAAYTPNEPVGSRFSVRLPAALAAAGEPTRNHSAAADRADDEAPRTA